MRQVFFRVGGREIEGGINTLNFHFGGRANFTPNFEYTFLALNLYIDLLLADMTPLESIDIWQPWPFPRMRTNAYLSMISRGWYNLIGRNKKSFLCVCPRVKKKEWWENPPCSFVSSHLVWLRHSPPGLYSIRGRPKKYISFLRNKCKKKCEWSCCEDLLALFLCLAGISIEVYFFDSISKASH